MTTPSPSPATEQPRVEERPAQPYVAIHAEGDAERFAATVDAAFPELFGWLAARGIAPAGPPFIHYAVFEPGGRFAVDVAAPVQEGVHGDERVSAGTLPAGRWVVHVHRGAYRATTPAWEGRDLEAAHALVLAWAEREGIAWAGAPASPGFAFAARVERYLAGPPIVSDPAEWETELAFLTAD